MVLRTEKARKSSKKQDPAQLFPLEIITNIISCLDAEDTETLRRVLKSWKAVSEGCNTKQAILERFPPARVPDLGTAAEYNLIFRRLRRSP